VIGPIGASVVSSVGKQWMATGSALVTVSRMVGMVVGLSALTAWGVRRFNGLAAGIETPIIRPPGLTDAQWQAMIDAATGATKTALHTVFSEFFLIAAIVMGAAAIPAIFFYRKRGGRAGSLPFLPH